MKYQENALKHLVTVFTVAFLLALTACGKEEVAIDVGKVKIRCEQNIAVNDIRNQASNQFCYDLNR